MKPPISQGKGLSIYKTQLNDALIESYEPVSMILPYGQKHKIELRCLMSEITGVSGHSLKAIQPPSMKFWKKC